MCFSFSLTKYQEYIEKKYKALFQPGFDFKPFYFKSAFDKPLIPVITGENPHIIQFLEWGLIPSWVNNKDFAEKIQSGTFNARAESIFEKPSFKDSILSKRCIIITDGFFEWHESNDKKYPFYIRLDNDESFVFAGIWDLWTDPVNNETKKTFSIITTEANAKLAKIHNIKKRMPVILNDQEIQLWLDKNSGKDIIQNLMRSYPEEKIKAHSVAKIQTGNQKNACNPHIIDFYNYKELGINL